MLGRTLLLLHALFRCFLGFSAWFFIIIQVFGPIGSFSWCYRLAPLFLVFQWNLCCTELITVCVCLPMNLWTFWGQGCTPEHSSWKISVVLNGSSLGHGDSPFLKVANVITKDFASCVMGAWNTNFSSQIHPTCLPRELWIQMQLFLGWGQLSVNLSYQTSLDSWCATWFFLI